MAASRPSYGSAQTVLGLGLALAAVGLWRGATQRRRAPLVYRPGGSGSFFALLIFPWRELLGAKDKDGAAVVEDKATRYSALAELHKLLDVVEQFLLPLSATGVCASNPPNAAALIHRKTRQCLVAASSQASQNPLSVPELLSLQAAEDELGAAAKSLEEYALVATHPLSALGQEAVAAAGIKTVYVLFPGSSYSINFNSTAPSAGAVRHSSRYQTLHVPELIGSAQTGPRSFADEDEMHQAQKSDREQARAQQRVIVLANIYGKLEAERAKN